MKIDIGIPHKTGLFITATDTEVGKTLIAGGICRVLANQNIKVGPMKPLASGCATIDGELVNSDAQFLAMAADSNLPIRTINPIAYTIPAATALCEKYENREVDYDLIAQAYKDICSKSDFVVIEGIGGLRVPISQNHDVVDLAQWFNLPIVLVARPDLGTINHTLLSVECIRNAGLNLLGVIISGYDEKSDSLAHRTAPRMIQEFGNVKILAAVPRFPQADTEKGILPQGVVDALAEIDWKKLASM